MQSKKSPFPWRPFLSKLAVIAIPVALQSLLTTTASMVDTIMVAPLGELSVAALGLCSQFASLMLAGYWGFVGGGTLFFSQYWGARDDEGIEQSYGITLTCMMTVALIFGALALFLPELVMKLYTDKAEIREIGVQYLRIVGFAYPMQIFSVCMSTLLRSTERVRIPMMASVLSVATNILLNRLFIYGTKHLPAMGIRGAALATACAAFVNAAAILIMGRITRYPYLFRFRRHFRWKKELFRLYMSRCFPIILNEVLLGIGNMVINVTLGRQPAYVIAALAVFRTLEGLIIGFFSGFSSASSVLVGTCVGAGEPDVAYERAKRLVYMCSGFILIAGVVIFSLRRPILTGMSLSGDSYRAGTRFLLIYLIAAVIRMGNWIQNDTYRASGDSVSGTVLEILAMYLMVIPLVLLSGFVWKLPYWVIFIFCYIDEPFRYILMQIHLYSGKWIRPVTDAGLAAMPAFFEERRRRDIRLATDKKSNEQ